MMGIKERDFRRLLADLSLEVLVPEDNFYGRLEERIDLSLVRELVRPLYAGGGRRSIDPVVFFKLQLILFFEDLMLRSSKAVNKSAPPMPRWPGRSSPHPRLRFAIQLASGHSRRLIYLEAIS